MSENTMGSVQHLGVREDDALIAVCSDQTVFIVDATCNLVLVALQGHSAHVTATMFSPHQPHLLVSISDDRTFCVWDVQDHVLVFRSGIESPAPFLSLAMDPRTHRIAIGTSTGRVQSYDLSTFRKLSTIDLAPLAATFVTRIQPRLMPPQEWTGKHSLEAPTDRKRAPIVVRAKASLSSTTASFSDTATFSEDTDTGSACVALSFVPETGEARARERTVALAGEPSLLVVARPRTLLLVNMQTHDLLFVITFLQHVPIQVPPTAGPVGLVGPVRAPPEGPTSSDEPCEASGLLDDPIPGDPPTVDLHGPCVPSPPVPAHVQHIQSTAALPCMGTFMFAP